MCGIVGIFNFESGRSVDPNILNRMNGMISHRGPDGEGIYVNGATGLGHRRLSIIDLELGRQPMVSKERHRAIVFNGEIYNFGELRKELEDRGMIFHTKSDTEVLLHMVETEQVSWLEKLNGMFSFAFWDERTRTLLIARDRLGIKPLYYSVLSKSLVFASEIKALLVHPEVARAVNESKVNEYMAFRSIAGNETLFKGIYQVPPGHAMVFKEGVRSPIPIQYWQEGKNLIEKDLDSPNTADRILEELFSSSVRYRLISDVPLGTFNSGGVDSSLVTSVVRSMSTGELHTFSVGFEEKSHDERAYAEVIAKKLGTNHHTLVMNEYEYADSLEKALWHLEEPLHHPHTVQLLALCKLAKEFVTVVLTGEGADELFAGYPRYNIPHVMPSYLRLPAVLSKQLADILTKRGARRAIKFLDALEFNNDREALLIHNSRPVPLSDYRRAITTELQLGERLSILRNGSKRFSSTLARLLYLEQRTYLSSLLSRLDKMSMASGIEARVPFLDYRLVESSYLVPDREKIYRLKNKWIVKKLAERWLPNQIVHRKKEGFGVPLSKWIRNPKSMGRYLALLEEKKTLDRGYFNKPNLESLIREHRSGVADHSEILWGMINLELWQRMFIDASFPN